MQAAPCDERGDPERDQCRQRRGEQPAVRKPRGGDERDQRWQRQGRQNALVPLEQQRQDRHVAEEHDQRKQADPQIASVIAEADEPVFGDIVLALETVAQEAADQEKPIGDHLVHLTVHGVLHLLGYDHLTQGEAAAMESLERSILAELGVADPYCDPMSSIEPAEVQP